MKIVLLFIIGLSFGCVCPPDSEPRCPFEDAFINAKELINE